MGKLPFKLCCKISVLVSYELVSLTSKSTNFSEFSTNKQNTWSVFQSSYEILSKCYLPIYKQSKVCTKHRHCDVVKTTSRNTDTTQDESAISLVKTLWSVVKEGSLFVWIKSKTVESGQPCLACLGKQVSGKKEKFADKYAWSMTQPYNISPVLRRLYTKKSCNVICKTFDNVQLVFYLMLVTHCFLAPG